MRQSSFQHVGRDVPRVDGVDKVTGRAKYTGDIVLPGMLEGRILRSPLPHARIRAIDTSRAEALRGVRAVVTAKDLTGIDPFYNGRPVVAMDKVPLRGRAGGGRSRGGRAHGGGGPRPYRRGLRGAAVRPRAWTRPWLAGAPMVHEDRARQRLRPRAGETQGDAERRASPQSHRVFEAPLHLPHGLPLHAWSPTARSARTTGADGIDAVVLRPAPVPGPGRPRAHLRRHPLRKVTPERVSYLGGGFGGKSYSQDRAPGGGGRRARRAVPVRLCLSVPEAMLTVRRHGATDATSRPASCTTAPWWRGRPRSISTPAPTPTTGPRMAAQLAATRVLGTLPHPAHLTTDAYAVHTHMPARRRLLPLRRRAPDHLRLRVADGRDRRRPGNGPGGVARPEPAQAG